jgi:uncharacterized membrane-anchored protein
MKRSLSLLALCAVLTGFLVWMVWDHQHARTSGQEIILDMEPVDPRSLFRGHYVTIRTPLHQIEKTLSPRDLEVKKGDTIFVVLQQYDSGNHWVVIEVLNEKPKDVDAIYLQGRIRWKSDESYSILYNFESYFADKTSAKALEKKVQDSKMRVILSVAPDGKAVIKGLEIDGVRFVDKL